VTTPHKLEPKNLNLNLHSYLAPCLDLYPNHFHSWLSIWQSWTVKMLTFGLLCWHYVRRGWRWWCWRWSCHGGWGL